MLEIKYQCKDINEVKELLLFQKENNFENNFQGSINKKIPSSEKVKPNSCNKCGAQKRFIQGSTNSNGERYNDFHTCDNCIPRNDGKFRKTKSKNINKNPDGIPCPDCGNFIRKMNSSFGDFYKCNCGRKIDARSDVFKQIIENGF